MMKSLATALLSLSLVFTTVTLLPDAQAATPIGFGMSANAVGAQRNAGVPADYGTFWIGPWTLDSGWAGPDGQMVAMKNAGVTPAIHFYYWGDDISPTCVEKGCWSSLHDVHKSRGAWDRLSQQLVSHLNQKMAGKPVVIFLESEFNKRGIETYEPFDGYLASKAYYIQKNYPNAKVVMALGNWNSGAWGTFDRTAAASDYIGLQGMRGSTRDTRAEYDSLYESTLSGARTAQKLFGKPIFITDIALSSYPEPTYVAPQAAELKQFFAGLDQLKAAGVKALVYRSWTDTPTMDLANYYGQAERHWGLAYTSGSYKPAANVWIDGVKAERAGSTTSPSPTPTSGDYSATFTPTKSINEWWIDVAVSAPSTPAKVEVRVNDGAWTALNKNSWGTWSKSVHAPKGADVTFRASTWSGQTAYSPVFQWMESGSSPSPTTSPSPSTSGYTASFSPSKNINEWWVDVAVSASSTPSKVEIRVNSGSWTTLSKNSWGTWSKSLHVPKGSDVVFRATSSSGQTATSPVMDWMGTSGGTTSGSTSSGSFSATFAPKSRDNNWWIEVGVGGTSTIAKVDARVNGGAWVALPKQSWGAYAKSIHAPDGSRVEFRATSTSGATDVSSAYTWG